MTSKRSHIGNPTSSELARMPWGKHRPLQPDLEEVAQKREKNKKTASSAGSARDNS